MKRTHKWDLFTQARKTKEAVDSWPQWMKDTAYFVGSEPCDKHRLLIDDCPNCVAGALNNLREDTERQAAQAQAVEWPEIPSEAVQESARTVSDQYPYKPEPNGEKLGYLQVTLLYKAMRDAHIAQSEK